MSHQRSYLACLLFVIFVAFSNLTLAESKAPDFTLPTIKGEQVSLSDFSGSYVYVDFWASWCGPCRDSLPWLQAVQSELSGHNIVFLTINIDQKSASAEKFLEDFNITELMVLLDPKSTTPKAYKLKGMPSAYLINPAGNIVYEHIGFKKALEEQYKTQLLQAISGKD